MLKMSIDNKQKTNDLLMNKKKNYDRCYLYDPTACDGSLAA